MEAVVYTSNTGSTEHYAKLLGYELSVSVYSTEEAGNMVLCDVQWSNAESCGYGACKNYTVRCICLHKMDMKLYRSAGLRESLA